MEASSTLTEELQRLADLRSRNDITEAEYTEAKRKLLSSHPIPPLAAEPDTVAVDGEPLVFKSSRWSSGNFIFPDRIEMSTDGVVFVKRGFFRSNREYINYRTIASFRVKNGLFLSDINIETSGGSQPIFANGLWKSDARKIQNLIRSHQGVARIDPMNPVYDSFKDLVTKRRATQHFTSETVPEEVITKALELAGQAPSGYNFQPWRFLVVRDKERKEALKLASFGQPKIGEAPVMIVAYGQRDGWKEYVDEIMEESTRRRGIEAQRETIKKNALNFVGQQPASTWINKHVMIAFTHLMLAFESLGWDTAPMEGFDATAVLQAMRLPEDTEVVALLAVGRGAQEPAHPGRLALGKIAFSEEPRKPWPAAK